MSSITMSSEDIASIDEMFIRLPIAQIKQLSHEYNVKIAQTKEDLHTLVGNKYRDLIKIAEDIDSMYSISQASDVQISNLSYKPAKFVSFTHDNYSKFDSMIRKDQAQEARLNSRAIVVRNIINKKLAKLDYKIRSGGSPLIHTSNFIYYAKVYYTIEKSFGDVLESNKSINSQFTTMKDKFKSYLESELSCYNLTDSIVRSTNNDKFRFSQRLTLKELTTNVLQDDYIDEELDEEELEEDEDKFENYELVNSKIESYDLHTLPINNYLISLTILLQTSFEEIVSSFIDIRFKFLQGLIEQVRSNSPEKINFFKIFKYIENTICYIQDYFKSETSDYFVGLDSVRNPWKASNLTGHRSWFDDTIIRFNLEGYKPITTSVELSQFPTLVFDMINELLTQEEIVSGVTNLSSTIFMFHNIMLSLAKLQDSIELSGSTSNLITMISSTDLLPNLLSQVIFKISDSFDMHISQLNTSIFDIIKEQLQSQTGQSQHKMFTNELVNIMDDNIDEYMKIITDTVSSSSEDAGGLVYSWFDEYTNYTTLVSTEQYISKLDIINCISHLSHTFKHINWGNFTMALFSSEFKKLGSNMNTSLWKQVELFVSSLSEFKTFEIVDYNFYLIGIISRIKDKLSQIDAPESTEIWKKIEGLCDGLFSNIVNNTPTDKFTSLFTEAIEEVSDSDDIPIRPSLKLISAMYVLAQEYSQISEDNSNYNIFITDWMRSNFVDIKNKWIRNKLVRELVDAYKSTKSTKKEGNLAENEDKQEEEEPEQKDAEEENGWDEEFDVAEVEEDKTVEEDQVAQEEKLGQAEESEANGKSPVKRSESLSFSVNYLFLLQFCNDPIDKPSLKQLVSVDDSILDIVIQGVTSHYKSNKNVYLPLSL